MGSSENGPSDKPLYVIGSILVALMVIVGFRTFVSINEAGHEGQPEDGYALTEAVSGGEAEDEENAAAVETAAADSQAPAGEAAPAADGGADIVALVAKADAGKGEKLFNRCKACHTYKKGDAPALGPNLYNVVDRDIGSQTSFTGYSTAMKDKPGNWTIENLSAFITDPKGFIDGTKMIYPGLKNDGKRADLLAYIKTLSE